MINTTTLGGMRSALLDCVPGKAQRTRLLAALARVPGNKTVSEMISWLIAREEDSPSQRASASQIPSPPPPLGPGLFEANVITYTRSPPEVRITMTKTQAIYLLEHLDRLAKEPRDHEITSEGTSVGKLYCTLQKVLGSGEQAPAKKRPAPELKKPEPKKADKNPLLIERTKCWEP